MAAQIPLPAREHVVWWPWPTGVSPLSRTSSPRNPKTLHIVHENFRRLHGAETHEREKLSGGEQSAGEIPPRRGEIEAIVTIIKLDFIGIIITIISIATSTAPRFFASLVFDRVVVVTAQTDRPQPRPLPCMQKEGILNHDTRCSLDLAIVS